MPVWPSLISRQKFFWKRHDHFYLPLLYIKAAHNRFLPQTQHAPISRFDPTVGTSDQLPHCSHTAASQSSNRAVTQKYGLGIISYTEWKPRKVRYSVILANTMILFPRNEKQCGGYRNRSPHPPVSSILINKNCSAVLKWNVPVKVRIATILLDYETESGCFCARPDCERCVHNRLVCTTQCGANPSLPSAPVRNAEQKGCTTKAGNT